MDLQDTSKFVNPVYRTWEHAPRLPFIVVPTRPFVTPGHQPLVVGPGQLPFVLR